MSDAGREAARQQALLRALWRDDAAAALGPWLAGPAAGVQRGLAAYQAHAGALAERALGAAYPTVRQLVGDEAFAALARTFWQAEPPQRGDVAEWGDALAGFLADAQALRELPYLPDLARLEWAVHRACAAADPAGPVAGLERLGDTDPARLQLRLAPGTALVPSVHPIVAIWQAHRSDDADRFAAARAALAEQRAETALVRRERWRVRVDAIPGAEAAFVAALLHSQALTAALDAAGPAFGFEGWLIAALRGGLLAAVGLSSVAS